MKSKYFIFIIILVLKLNLNLFAQDSLYCFEVINFLQKNDYVIKTLKPLLLVRQDTVCIFNSTDMISFSPQSFIDEIIDYEFDSCNYDKKSLSNYLKLIPPEYLIKDKEIINYSTKYGNVIAFFSQIIDNKMITILKIYDDHYPPTYAYNFGFGSGNKILFLAYFDDNYVIKKFFFKFVSG